jgi:hypothetical protein
MITLVDAVVGLFFSLWFVFSVIAQFECTLTRRIRAFDYLGLVPGWTFFAPVPGMSDYHLIYRQATPDSAPGEWVEVPIIQSRRWFHFAWNPERRKSKVLTDAVMTFALQMSDAKPRENEVAHAVRLLPLTVPYLMLLSIIMARDRKEPASAGAHRQFAVVKRSGGPDARMTVVFGSRYHRVD